MVTKAQYKVKKKELDQTYYDQKIEALTNRNEAMKHTVEGSKLKIEIAEERLTQTTDLRDFTKAMTGLKQQHMLEQGKNLAARTNQLMQNTARILEQTGFNHGEENAKIGDTGINFAGNLKSAAA